MGDGAAEAIIAERDANGPYKSIFNFAERVNLSACNRKAFESLVLSGGFDGFGIPREAYFEANSKGDMFLDSLVRYGQLFQAEQAQAQNSLFGGIDAVEIATPPIPKAESWSAIERLNKERDLVGIYLSAHPLDEYSIVLHKICNTHCDEIENKEELAKKEEIQLGGIVTAVRDTFTRNGKPCGFVTLEDFNGSGELAFFGEDWGRWKGMLSEGCSVFIRAKCAPRWRDSNTYDLRVSDIQFLQTVKEKYIEKLTINIDNSVLDDSVVDNLVTLVNENPGTTQLFIRLYEAGNAPLLLRSTDKMVEVSKNLIDFLDEHDGMEYSIN